MTNIGKYKSRLRAIDKKMSTAAYLAGQKKLMRKRFRRLFKQADDEKAPLLAGQYWS